MKRAHLTLDPQCLAGAWPTQGMPNKRETKRALYPGIGTEATQRMAALHCVIRTVLKPSRVSQSLQDEFLTSQSFALFLHSLHKQLLSAYSRPGTVLANLCPNKVSILENMDPSWNVIREGDKLP